MLRELNKDSLLLLYLADELAPDDRAEVDKKLAGDEALRQELNLLDGVVQSFEAGMTRLDSAPVSSEVMGLRRIGAAMRQHAAARLAQPAPEPVPVSRNLRYPWWVYPLASAAAVLVALLSWWGHRPDQSAKLPAIDTIPRLNAPLMPPSTSEDATQLVKEMTDNFGNGNPTQPEKSVASLDVAEDQLAEISRSRELMLHGQDDE